MFKKTIILLISIASLEIITLAVFNSSMTVSRAGSASASAKQKTLIESLRVNQKALPAAAAQTLTVFYLDKKAELITDGSREVIGKFLLGAATEINRPAQDPVLTIEGDRATGFRPNLDGQTLDLAGAQELIISALLTMKPEVVMPVVIKKPKVKLADLNSLGIKELIATGKSDFTGSSADRLTNIRVGSAQYSGVIVKQGEEFSFNDHLGPVDAAHGFKPELVIKTINGQPGAVPELGGGLCQVSTTAFRAAFFAGLPITARRNHSFPVRYYEWIDENVPRVVGLDATIYTGVQDMKFINDTPGAILIWTRIEGKRLYFDFYGTTDDREILVDGPHPYDRRASGAVKSKVTRIVKKLGEDPVELTYDSKYIPMVQAVTAVQYPTAPPPPQASPENPPETSNPKI